MCTCERARAAAKRMAQTISWSSSGGTLVEAETDIMWRVSKDCNIENNYKIAVVYTRTSIKLTEPIGVHAIDKNAGT